MSCNFCDGGLISHLLDLKWIILHDFMPRFMRYPISSFQMQP